jgi:hypothetical protein
MSENSPEILSNQQLGQLDPPTISEEQINQIVKDQAKKLIDFEKSNTLTIIGIFASLIAFLSVEIQIVRTICDPVRLLGLSFIFLGGQLLFLFLLYVISFGLKYEKINWKSLLITITGILFPFIIGALIILALPMKDELLCKTEQIEQLVKSKIISNTEQTTKEDINQMKEIIKIQKDIEYLKQDINEIKNNPK